MAEGGGAEKHNHTYHEVPTTPSWRVAAGKQRETALSEWRAAPKRERYSPEPTATWTGEEEDSCLMGSTNPLTKDDSTFPWGSLVHAFTSYGHVYGFFGEGCTRCIPNQV